MDSTIENKKINKLITHIGNEGKHVLEIIYDLKQIKKLQTDILNEKLSIHHQKLINLIVSFFENGLPAKSVALLHAPIVSVPVEDKYYHTPLIVYLVSSTLKTGIMRDPSDPYILFGSSLANISIDSVLPSIISSFEDCVDLCKSISERWPTGCEITCNDGLWKSDHQIQFGFNGSKLVHE